MKNAGDLRNSVGVIGIGLNAGVLFYLHIPWLAVRLRIVRMR